MRLPLTRCWRSKIRSKERVPFQQRRCCFLLADREPRLKAVGRLLLSMTNLSSAAVVGTDLVFGLVLSLIGGGVNAAMGTLSEPVLLQLLTGVPGAILGAFLAGKVPSKQLRMGLSGAMALQGANL
jgi:hypothetical protein